MDSPNQHKTIIGNPKDHGKPIYLGYGYKYYEDGAVFASSALGWVLIAYSCPDDS